MKRAVIISNGDIFDYDKIKKHFSKDDFFICADGAIRHFIAMNIFPDVWIGDFDSCTISDEQFNKICKNTKVIRLNPIKDCTDTEECVNYAIDNGFKNVLIAGFGGTRLDHTMATVFMLKKLTLKGIFSVAINENNKVFYIDNKMEFDKDDYTYLSIIPISKKIENVTLTGLEYPMDNGVMENYYSLGVSNKIKSLKCTVSIGCGEGFVIMSKD